MLPTDSVLKNGSGRSFHAHISVHNSNKDINATKNTNLCTYSLAKEDDNLHLIALQNVIIKMKLSGKLLTLLHRN